MKIIQVLALLLVLAALSWAQEPLNDQRFFTDTTTLAYAKTAFPTNMALGVPCVVTVMNDSSLETIYVSFNDSTHAWPIKPLEGKVWPALVASNVWIKGSSGTSIYRMEIIYRRVRP